MSTPKDRDRIAAFRGFVDKMGTVDDAAALLDMDRRQVNRMRTTRPAPPRLLEKCARWADQQGWDKQAARLFDAAQPADPIRSMTGGGLFVYFEDGVMHEIDLAQSDLTGGTDA